MLKLARDAQDCLNRLTFDSGYEALRLGADIKITPAPVAAPAPKGPGI